MTAPAAGWYHDPSDSGAWRWWDGASWTDHVQPVEEPAAPVVAAVVIEPVPTHPPVFEQSAPPAPEPAPAPEPVAAPVAPVDAQTIPQPGQVAPAPAAAPAGNVSLTPAIPVTDQAYWHSANAEMVDVPRINHTSTGSIAVQNGPKLPSYVRDWNDLGSPNTGGIWLLAFSPLIYVGVSFFIGLINGLSGSPFGQYVSLVAIGVYSGLNWVFAYADQRALRDRGYHPPAVWWMLLLPFLPLGYLIARGRAVRREGMRAWPPELVFFLCFFGVIAMTVLSVLALAAFLSGIPGI